MLFALVAVVVVVVVVVVSVLIAFDWIVSELIGVVMSSLVKCSLKLALRFSRIARVLSIVWLRLCLSGFSFVCKKFVFMFV